MSRECPRRPSTWPKNSIETYVKYARMRTIGHMKPPASEYDQNFTACSKGLVVSKSHHKVLLSTLCIELRYYSNRIYNNDSRIAAVSTCAAPAGSVQCAFRGPQNA